MADVRFGFAALGSWLIEATDRFVGRAGLAQSRGRIASDAAAARRAFFGYCETDRMSRRKRTGASRLAPDATGAPDRRQHGGGSQ
jgi:hypothetical protein